MDHAEGRNPLRPAVSVPYSGDMHRRPPLDAAFRDITLVPTYAPTMALTPFGPCAGPATPYGSPQCGGRGVPVIDCLSEIPTAQIMLCRQCQETRVNAYISDLLGYAGAAGVGR